MNQELTGTLGHQALLEDINTHDEIAYAMLVNPDLEIIGSSNMALIGVTTDDVGTRSAAVEGTPDARQTYYDLGGIQVYDVNYPVLIEDVAHGASDQATETERGC